MKGVGFETISRPSPQIMLDFLIPQKTLQATDRDLMRQNEGTHSDVGLEFAIQRREKDGRDPFVEVPIQLL